MEVISSFGAAVMTAMSHEIPTGLNDAQVFRLFKCALKDDDTLIDAIVEKLYRSMKDFDPGRARTTVALMVDRDTTAGSTFGALLEDLWPRRSAPNLAA
jgi:hypothetical protein